MAFIKAKHEKPKGEFKHATIEQEVIDDFELYVRYIGSDRAYVLQEILRKVMTRDKKFQEQKKSGKSTPIEAGKPEKGARTAA